MSAPTDGGAGAFEPQGVAPLDPRTFRTVLGQFCTGVTIITTVDDDELGPVRMQNVMWRMGRSPGAIRHAGRPAGADTDRVLSHLGCTPEHIDELRARGVI